MSGQGQTMTGSQTTGRGWFYSLCHRKPLLDLSRELAQHRIGVLGKEHSTERAPQGICANPCLDHSHHDFSLLYEVLF